MIYIILYLMVLAGILYWLGGILMETHVPIEQELVKPLENDYLYGVDYIVEEIEEIIEG